MASNKRIDIAFFLSCCSQWKIQQLHNLLGVLESRVTEQEGMVSSCHVTLLSIGQHLVSRPAQIYNVDKWHAIGPQSSQCDCRKRCKEGLLSIIGSCNNWKKGHVTIVAYANVAGQAIPPMVIYDMKNLNHAWTASVVPGTMYGLSDKEWINTDLLEGWLV